MVYNYIEIKDSPYDPTKLAVHPFLHPENDFISNFGHIFEKTVSFDDMLHLIGEENILIFVDFACGITFCPEASRKVNDVNR